MDYLETDDDIDHKRIAIMGHSKMGKATLWTAAQDERFALAISAQSGCAGAALWRRKSGETLRKMVTRFPYWLCRNAWKFVEQEDGKRVTIFFKVYPDLRRHKAAPAQPDCEEMASAKRSP